MVRCCDTYHKDNDSFRSKH